MSKILSLALAGLIGIALVSPVLAETPNKPVKTAAAVDCKKPENAKLADCVKAAKAAKAAAKPADAAQTTQATPATPKK
ncbi:MAG: hypothetical protein HY246_15225 [Proteobacteria bacterium]|nr:hypothetical protein [Pseudomonadota bacterium]